MKINSLRIYLCVMAAWRRVINCLTSANDKSGTTCEVRMFGWADIHGGGQWWQSGAWMPGSWQSQGQPTTEPVEGTWEPCSGPVSRSYSDDTSAKQRAVHHLSYPNLLTVFLTYKDHSLATFSLTKFSLTLKLFPNFFFKSGISVGRFKLYCRHKLLLFWAKLIKTKINCQLID